LESPLISSPRNIMSSFSPYADFSQSSNSNSPGRTNSSRFSSLYVMYELWYFIQPLMVLACRSAHSSAGSSNLRPSSMDGASSVNGAGMNSPLDMVGPSPVTSNGTETTEIEDEVAEEVHTNKVTPPSKRLSTSTDTQATVSAASSK
jgi:hypothetical protein